MNGNENRFLFVIGPQRAGTTWLYSFLAAQSSDVFLDRLEKENYFFSRYARRSAAHQRQRFLARITGRGTPRLCADVCSTYFAHRDTVEGILAAFPEARFAYIHRDEAARRKSFAAHHAFNKLSVWILGYEISWALYEKQADFLAFETWLQTRVPQDRRCRLDFDDLTTNNGKAWTDALSDMMDVTFEPVNLGVVNKSRQSMSKLKRVLFVGVRLVQATRLHILVKAIRQRLTVSDFKTAAEAGAQ